MANEKRLIYMDDTMDRLRAYADRKHQAGHTELANGILKAVNYIHNEISRVDAVEVIHAYWMYEDELDESGDLQAHCSNCLAFDLHAPRKKNDVPYCWRCGAKMDGDGNG